MLPSLELRSGWRIVGMAALGTAVGISGLFTYTAGLFLPPLRAEIGLTNTEFGLSFFLTTLAVAAFLPCVGSIVDAGYGRIAVALSAIFLALAFLSASAFVRTSTDYIVIMLLLGIVGAATTPLAYNRLIGGMFERHRGLALGITQTGIGLAAALVPPLVGAIIKSEGWRAGYNVLAAIALIGLPVALVCLRHRPPERAGVASTSAAAIFRTGLFWHSTSAFALMAASLFGPLAHLVPFLSLLGMDAGRASLLAGVLGVSTIVSRVLMGWLVDRISPPFLMTAVCAACGAAMLGLVNFGLSGAIPAALILGAAVGAEADLLSFVCFRYFGLSVFGRIYGIQFGIFLISAGLGPLWIGYVLDITGSYMLALTISAGGLFTAALLFAALPWGARVRPGGGEIS